MWQVTSISVTIANQNSEKKTLKVLETFFKDFEL